MVISAVSDWVVKNGKTFYYVSGAPVKGLYEIDGEYYYFHTGNGVLYKNCTVWVSKTNAYGLAAANYEVGADGKLCGTGFIAGSNGATYYYEDFQMVKGLQEIDGQYYYFGTGTGKMAVNTTIWISKTNPYGLTAGTYSIGADGVVIL